MTAQPPSLSHALRVAASLFVGLAMLLAVCAPFLDGIEPAVFLGLGLGYCLVLAFSGVGFALAVPSRIVGWWLAASALPVFGVGTVGILVNFSPSALFDLPAALLWGLWALLGASLVAGCALAGWGWLRYLRRKHTVPHVLRRMQ